MNNIVWVIGESAAGKTTFISFAVANPDCELMHQLGYYNKKFIPVKESIYLGDYERITIRIWFLIYSITRQMQQY